MFIEKNKNIFLITKKVQNKKISVSLDGKSVGDDDIEKLTQKEIQYLTNTEGFQLFASSLFSPEKLTKLLHNALLETNMLKLGGLSGLKTPKYDDFAIHFIYESNKTEGSRIPQDEVQKIIERKKYSYKVKNEVQEVKNSIIAWDFLQNEFQFSLAHIKRLYHILTRDLVQENGLKYPRGFKKIPVVVNNQATTSPEHVERELKMLIMAYKKNKNILFPLQNAFDFHLGFEQIHPFENGNGRIGRLIMNKILLSSGLPPCIVFAENRQAYFASIASANERNKKKYYQFMVEQYEKTLHTKKGSRKEVRSVKS